MTSTYEKGKSDAGFCEASNERKVTSSAESDPFPNEEFSPYQILACPRNSFDFWKPQNIFEQKNDQMSKRVLRAASPGENKSAHNSTKFVRRTHSTLHIWSP